MAKQRTYNVGVVVPILNNFEGAAELLASIKTRHHWTPYVQPQWRAQVPLAAAWNRGFDQATERFDDYVLIVNDDVMLAPFTIDRMIDEYQRLRDRGVVLVSANNIIGQLSDPYQILEYEEKGEVSWAEHPNYSCFLVASDFFKLVGRFDENFWPAWWEDSDSHYRIKLLGYHAITTTAAPSVHYGSVTTKRLPTPPDSGHSQAYFLKKWGSVNRTLDEVYETPYDDPKLSPKDWHPNYPV